MSSSFAVPAPPVPYAGVQVRRAAKVVEQQKPQPKEPSQVVETTHLPGTHFDGNRSQLTILTNAMAATDSNSVEPEDWHNRSPVE